MNCLVCDTPILERDKYFWALDENDSDGCVHDDCMIRAYEFADEFIKAGDIFRDSDAIYKGLPDGSFEPNRIQTNYEIKLIVERIIKNWGSMDRISFVKKLSDHKFI